MGRFRAKKIDCVTLSVDEVIQIESSFGILGIFAIFVKEWKANLLLECQYCEHKAKIKSKLDRHVKEVHQRVREFECQYCDYKKNLSRFIDIMQHILG